MEAFSVFPHGLSLGQGTFRAAMIFKDKKESEVLPIWLDNVEANILIASSQVAPREFSPHRGSLKILDHFDINLESVHFSEVEDSTQYAEVTAIQGKKKLKIKMRAADALSLALNAGCTFSANKDVVEKSRTLNFQMATYDRPDLNIKKNVEALH